MSKEKIVYKEGYRKGSMVLRDDCLPILSNVPSDMAVRTAEIKEAGIIEQDGQRMEYQVMRIVFDPMENNQ